MINLKDKNLKELSAILRKKFPNAKWELAPTPNNLREFIKSQNLEQEEFAKINNIPLPTLHRQLLTYESPHHHNMRLKDWRELIKKS